MGGSLCDVGSTGVRDVVETTEDEIVIHDGLKYEDIKVGHSAERSFDVTQMKVAFMCAISGDKNPMHFVESYAQKTRFRGLVVHGVLTASFISATFAHELPGPGWAPTELSLKFRAPVRIGDMVRVKVTVLKKLPRKRLRLGVQCHVKDTCVLKAEAEMVDVRE